MRSISGAGARAAGCLPDFLAAACSNVASGAWMRSRAAGCNARTRPMSGTLESIAAALGFPGVWFLNGSYQWSCTATARDEDGVPWLARTLDWPFPGLGRHLEIARMRGAAGEFINVTWPGYAGVLTASAPGRFAAAINQAPLRRRTRHPWLRPYDLAMNALQTWPVRVLPARPSAARGVRNLPSLRRSQAPARDGADRASGDLHARRLRARRALRDRAHRGGISSVAAKTPRRPTTGCARPRPGRRGFAPRCC